MWLWFFWTSWRRRGSGGSASWRVLVLLWVRIHLVLVSVASDVLERNLCSVLSVSFHDNGSACGAKEASEGESDWIRDFLLLGRFLLQPLQFLKVQETTKTELKLFRECCNIHNSDHIRHLQRGVQGALPLLPLMPRLPLCEIFIYLLFLICICVSEGLLRHLNNNI